jgi:hypothetical protein
MLKQKKASNRKARDLGASWRCWVAWKNMHARCTLKSYQGYMHYGGRGITVCEHWGRGNPDGFLNFFNDMGNPPDGLSLDRIDTDGNYTPSNCRWADKSTQVTSRRKFGALTSFSPDELSKHVRSLSDEQLGRFIRSFLSKMR